MSKDPGFKVLANDLDCIICDKHEYDTTKAQGAKRDISVNHPVTAI